MSHSIPTPDFMTTLDPTRDYKINVRSNNPNQPGQKEPSFISVAHPGLLSNNPNVLSTFTNESSEHCTLNFINEQGETVVSRGEPLDEAELGAFLEFDEVTQEFYLTLLDAQYVFRDPQDQENVQDNLLSEIEAAFEDVPQPDTEPDPLPPKVTRPIDPPSKPTTSSRSQLKVTSPTRKRRSPASRPTSNYNSIPTHTNQSSSEITNLSDKLNSAHLNKSTRSPVKKPIPTTKPKPKSKPTKPEKVPSPEAASPPADDDSFGCFDLIGIDAKSEPEVEPDTMEEVEFSDFGDEIFEDVDDSLMEEPVKVPSPEPVVKPAPKATVKPPAKPASKPVHKRTGADKKETTQKKKYRSSSSESSSSSSGSSSSGSGSSSSGSSSSSSGSSSDSDSDSNSDSEEDKKPPVKAKSKSKPKPKPKSKPKSPPVSQPAQPVVETTKGFSDNDFADIGAEAASGLSDQFDEVDFGFDQPSEPLPAIDLFQAKSSSEDEAPAPVLPPSSTTAPPQLNSSDFSSDNDQRYEKVTLNFSDDDDNSFDLV